MLCVCEIPQEMKKSKTQKVVSQIQGDEEKMNMDKLFRIYVNIIRYDQISSLA